MRDMFAIITLSLLHYFHCHARDAHACALCQQILSAPPALRGRAARDALLRCSRQRHTPATPNPPRSRRRQFSSPWRYFFADTAASPAAQAFMRFDDVAARAARCRAFALFIKENKRLMAITAKALHVKEKDNMMPRPPQRHQRIRRNDDAPLPRAFTPAPPRRARPATICLLRRSSHDIALRHY